MESNPAFTSSHADSTRELNPKSCSKNVVVSKGSGRDAAVTGRREAVREAYTRT
jgi:hypothetical protein